MMENELNEILENAYNILREKSVNILMAIKLIGGIELKCKGNYKLFTIFDDCLYLQKSFKKLDMEIIEIEKQFIDKIFSEYEDIQPGWTMHTYIDKHILIYSAILFHNLNDYILFNKTLIEQFYITFPYKYKYHIKSGKELLRLQYLLNKNYKLYKDKLDKYTPYVLNNVEIKNDKFYILREYYMKDSFDLCYTFMDNVFIFGINSLSKAEKTINKLNYFNSKLVLLDTRLFLSFRDIEFF